ncbi:MAG: hypothetical protein H6994_13920 [Pseudomonadales bacterium]|nr:hypothetical protein [Pseudomonadales bacterium]
MIEQRYVTVRETGIRQLQQRHDQQLPENLGRHYNNNVNNINNNVNNIAGKLPGNLPGNLPKGRHAPPVLPSSRIGEGF